MSIYEIKPISDNDRITIKRVINELESVSKFFDMSIYDILLGSKPNEHFISNFTQSAYTDIQIGRKLVNYCQTPSNNKYDEISKQIIFLVPTILNIDLTLIPPVRKLNNNIIDSIVQNLPNFEIIKEVMKQTIGLDKWYEFLIYVFQSEAKSRYERKRLKEYRIKNKERIKQLRNDPINPLDVDIILFIQQLKINVSYVSKISNILLNNELEIVDRNMKRDLFKVNNEYFIREYIRAWSISNIGKITYNEFKSRKLKYISEGYVHNFNKGDNTIKYLTRDRCWRLRNKYPKLKKMKGFYIEFNVDRRHFKDTLLIDYFNLIWRQYENKIIKRYNPSTVIRYKTIIRQCVDRHLRTDGFRLYYRFFKELFKKFESLDFVIHLIRYFKPEEIE